MLERPCVKSHITYDSEHGGAQSTDLAARLLGFQTGSANYWLRDLEQITEPLWA